MTLRFSRSEWLIMSSLFCCLSGSLAGDTSDSTFYFVRNEVMIPMRDGVKLHTVIFVPRELKDPLPILLSRTPYGALSEEKDLRASNWHLLQEGYIFAFQDEAQANSFL